MAISHQLPRQRMNSIHKRNCKLWDSKIPHSLQSQNASCIRKLGTPAQSLRALFTDD